MLAPHSQAIQTWPSSPPPSSSPHRRCSWRRALSADSTSGMGRDATTNDECEHTAAGRDSPASSELPRSQGAGKPLRGVVLVFPTSPPAGQLRLIVVSEIGSKDRVSNWRTVVGKPTASMSVERSLAPGVPPAAIAEADGPPPKKSRLNCRIHGASASAV